MLAGSVDAVIVEPRPPVVHHLPKELALLTPPEVTVNVPALGVAPPFPKM